MITSFIDFLHESMLVLFYYLISLSKQETYERITWRFRQSIFCLRVFKRKLRGGKHFYFIFLLKWNIVEWKNGETNRKLKLNWWNHRETKSAVSFITCTVGRYNSWLSPLLRLAFDHQKTLIEAFKLVLICTLIQI